MAADVEYYLSSKRQTVGLFVAYRLTFGGDLYKMVTGMVHDMMFGSEGGGKK